MDTPSFVCGGRSWFCWLQKFWDVCIVTGLFNYPWNYKTYGIIAQNIRCVSLSLKLLFKTLSELHLTFVQKFYKVSCNMKIFWSKWPLKWHDSSSYSFPIWNLIRICPVVLEMFQTKNGQVDWLDLIATLQDCKHSYVRVHG